MEWTCPQCTFSNSIYYDLCEMCEQGERPESTNICFDVFSPTNVEDRSDEQVESQNTTGRRSDVYVRYDGQLLHDELASQERKQSMSRRKALDLQKILQQSGESDSSESDKDVSNTSTSHVHGSFASIGAAATAYASKSKGHLNALTAHARGANASASATTEYVSASALNANATGANASASTSATAARTNALNANATSANVSVSANASGINVATGNLNVTGVDAAASASVSAAKVQVGNVDVTGASAGTSASVNGTGVSAFNVAVGGASAAVSMNVDGSLSFGNINIGLRPSLDIGFGLNLGIPFLSGSKMGSNGSGGGGGQANEQKAPGGVLQNAQDYLSDKFPNQRIYKTPVDVSIKPNSDGQAIDPVLPNTAIANQPSDGDTSAAASVIKTHDERLAKGMKFVGFKGCPPPSTTTNTSTQAPVSNSDPAWEGLYTSPNPDVAAGYVGSDDGKHVGDIKRVYIPENAAKLYYTKRGLETPEARIAVMKIKEHSEDKYVFSGPQDSKNPDLLAPETIISPTVRDELKANGTLKFESSAHIVDRESRKLKQYNQDELNHSIMVPDFLVNIKTAEDCAKHGGRERLAHVFQGQPSAGCWNNPSPPPKNDKPKPPDNSEDDKLLLEECAKLGIYLKPKQLRRLKKKLKSDEEYERDEALSRQRNNNRNAKQEIENSRAAEDEEITAEVPKPCKDHAANIRCFKCLKSSSGLRTRKINKNIHGFQHSE